MNTEKTPVSYRVWDEEQCRAVAESAFRILENTGCIIRNAEARRLLADRGAEVKGELVKIPAALTRWAVEQAPSELTLYNRDGNPAMELRPGSVYFGPAITITQISDPVTGQRRKSVTADSRSAAIVLDALDNLAWASPCTSASDAKSTVTDLAELLAVLPNTRKPVMYWSLNVNTLAYQFEMFEAVAGGEEALRQKPFMINLVCPMDPLTHNDDSLAQLMFLARRMAPAVYIAGIGIGLSGPATVAGSVAVGMADTLAGLVVSQLARPGAPFVVSKFTDNVDMKNMSITHSNPEMLLANAATADVFRYLGLPFCSNFAGTDSGRLDQIAAFDKGIQIYTALLSGTNMNFAMGAYESGAYMKLEDLVYGNELIGFLRVLTQGAEVSEDALAEDVVDEVGPGGVFYMEEHTLDHLHDFWRPDLLPAQTQAEWEAGGRQDLDERLRQRVLQILEKGPRHPLPRDVEDKLNEIMARAERAL